MKIVILNATASLSSNEYSTILSEQGLIDADKIATYLAEEINPDIIYSSPYVRALQTIYPYCQKYNKKVNAECCLYPLARFDSGNYLYHDISLTSLPSYFHYLYHIIDSNYTSRVFHSNVSQRESPRLIGNRVFPFLYALKTEYQNTNKTILIVSHRDICPYFLKYFDSPEADAEHSIYIIDCLTNHHDHKHIVTSTF